MDWLAHRLFPAHFDDNDYVVDSATLFLKLWLTLFGGFLVLAAMGALLWWVG